MNHPNLLIFFRGVETTNQNRYCIIIAFILVQLCLDIVSLSIYASEVDCGVMLGLEFNVPIMRC